jgi:hypothetical protein
VSHEIQRPKVFADFNNADKQGRIRLNTVGTIRDLDRLGIVLQEGAELLLSCLELETEGHATYSEDEHVWVASINWDQIRELS